MISERGIESNPEKIQALLMIEPPKSYKEVQKLIGCLAALNRFISKSGKKNLPFFKNVRRISQERFTWDEESNKRFRRTKRVLKFSPVTFAPRIRGDIIIIPRDIRCGG
ncbi:hypothetical protein LIER_05246 [Lithospermum erythrorhizon]|uniref:Reverse transcriptase n=1 Tax=Lithospermum erythrorhizon TaxID=34254 RepID=A0AAV3NZU8_LITER